jgi:nucleotide-binding universal stress UspA family protein
MSKTQRIIVGVSGPKNAYPAIEWALAYAPGAQAEVELVHVVDLSWRTSPAPFAETALLAAERELRDLAARYSAQAGAPVHATALVGHPVRALVDHAAGAGMIVLGTHHDDAGGHRFNTFAARVAGRAGVSTVVVPHLTAEGSGIVVGVDGSELSVAPLAFAAREADRLGEKLTVVHSWHAPRPWADGEVAGWPATPEDEERRVLAESVAGLAQSYPDLAVTSLVVFARAADALYDAARGARMLVVGSHGRQGLEKAWLGSTSEELVLAPPTTIAVIR